MIAKLDDGTHWAVTYDAPSLQTRNWLPIYVPAPNLKIEHTNVASADSGRTEDGVMHINWVRPDVKKVYLLYNSISGYEKGIMEQLLQGKEFWFRYMDVQRSALPSLVNGKYANTYVTTVQEIHAYTGESSYESYCSTLRAEEGGIYTNFSINVIEF